ncbi:MAG: class I SAM-dependent methyltransferase [Anaerolineales bacterium]
MLPDVKGLRVLDAGCGPGVYAAWLLKKGADVVAVDANQKMARLAKARLGDRCPVMQANLEQPLDFLRDGWFDVAVSPLVMDYIRDWHRLFQEFHRVLKTGGVLVFSIEHPYMKYAIHKETSHYFDVELVEYKWKGFGKAVKVPSYRRPMSEVINPLLEAGFNVDKILEPKPTEAFKEQLPEEYEELTRRPGFLCLRAVKGHVHSPPLKHDG